VRAAAASRRDQRDHEQPPHELTVPPPFGRESKLGISEYQVAVGGTFYIAGAAVGALGLWGYLAILCAAFFAASAAASAGYLTVSETFPLEIRALAIGYWIAAGLMAIAAVTEIVLGVDAEQRSLEEVAEPLSAT
jgi:hypothetical protein